MKMRISILTKIKLKISLETNLKICYSLSKSWQLAYGKSQNEMWSRRVQISPHIKILSSLFLSAVLRWSSVRRRGENVRFAGGLTASKMRRLVAPFVCFAFFVAVSGKLTEDLISVVFKVMRTRCVWNKIREKIVVLRRNQPLGPRNTWPSQHG